MKYGVLFNKNNVNLGDDIQAYATARFYPSLDYFVDREHIHQFRSENNEPVAVIMNAWYMWEKWHWPPSRCIVPHMVGFHYADHELSLQPGSPLKYEALEGLGGEYLKAYSPIGCRDYYTMGQLEKLGIDCYFSGCITLTLPQMPIVKPEKEYICIVDVDKAVQKKLVDLLKDSGYEIKIMTHTGSRDENRTWEQRKEKVEELLTTYRNAKCVITKKLHCSLPCLSQGTPVVLIKQMDDDIRFSPYYSFLHYIKTDDFLAGNYEYDFNNTKPNKPDYITVREALIKSCEDFVARISTEERSAEELDRFTATDEEVYQWRYDLMDRTLRMWLEKTRQEHKDLKKLKSERTRLKKQVNALTAENEKLRQNLTELSASAPSFGQKIKNKFSRK
ncbi:MAG: polysaccharide pyruvyl transferase family protein [bacterium]|nr:polysaccharide pyruvyl transferase family protein [bacterium]